MAFGLSAGAAALVGAVAAPVVGGLMAGDAAGDAADAQSAAAREASATQEAARKQQRQDLMPWTSGGGLAQNELLRRLGLRVNPGTSNGTGVPGLMTEAEAYQIAARNYANTNPLGIGGTLEESVASGRTRQADVDATVRSIMDSENAARTAAYQASQANQPAATAETGPDAYGSLLTPAPAYKQFTQEDLNNDLVFQNTFKTALDTGLNQINARAASGGNYGSGAALKALTRFGAQTANTYTGDAYNRNLTEQNNLYNRDMAGKRQIYNFLSGPSQQGQNAAAGVGAAGISTANNIASNQLAAGNAQSAGMVGSANALSGGIADATNAYQWNQLLNKKQDQDYWAGINSYLYSNAGSGG
ncbi:MAG: hypothetical protein Q7T46_11415 [Polaromonas sp.]|nr:hypothetical protein [Polaromonas sp.]